MNIISFLGCIVDKLEWDFHFFDSLVSGNNYSLMIKSAYSFSISKFSDALAMLLSIIEILFMYSAIVYSDALTMWLALLVVAYGNTVRTNIDASAVLATGYVDLTLVPPFLFTVRLPFLEFSQIGIIIVFRPFRELQFIRQVFD